MAAKDSRASAGGGGERAGWLTEGLAIVRGPSARLGALDPGYRGLVLVIEGRRIASARRLAVALARDPEGTGDDPAWAMPEDGTWTEAAGDDDRTQAVREWTLKLLLAQHGRSVGRALAETAGKAIVVAGPPPWGARRRAGRWEGQGHLGGLWERIRERWEARGGQPVRGATVPDAAAGTVRIGGRAVRAVRSDGGVLWA